MLLGIWCRSNSPDPAETDAQLRHPSCQAGGESGCPPSGAGLFPHQTPSPIESGMSPALSRQSVRQLYSGSGCSRSAASLRLEINCLLLLVGNCLVTSCIVYVWERLVWKLCQVVFACWYILMFIRWMFTCRSSECIVRKSFHPVLVTNFKTLFCSRCSWRSCDFAIVFKITGGKSVLILLVHYII